MAERPLYHFPRDLEQIISARAEEIFPAEPQAVAEAVLRLSDLFLGKRPWDPDYSRDRRLRRAYLEYFLPTNLPKIQLALGRWLAPWPTRWAGRRLRVLDLGAGPGTALLGLCDWVRRMPEPSRPATLDLAAADQCRENLEDAEWLLRALAADPKVPPLRFQGFRTDLVADRAGLLPMATVGGRYDLVVAANVLCELDREPAERVDRALRLVATVAAEALDPAGAILLLEPGLKETARDLHRLRDRILSEREAPRIGLRVHAPCLHEEPCPALATSRDWCFAALPWSPTAAVAEIDRRTGLDKRSLKFAYLLLSPLPPPATPPGRWRLVSDVRDLKGERRLYLCGEGRWIVLADLKRHRRADAFSDLLRGDLLEVGGIAPRGAVYRLDTGGFVRRVGEGLFPEPAGASLL